MSRVVDVARRRRIAPQQVAIWRREARQGKPAPPVDDDAGFALRTLEEQAAPPSPPPPAPAPVIAIGRDGLTIRLPAGTPPERIAAVASALRRAR